MIGEIVVTKNAAGQIVAVTQQDEEGRILSVIAESAPASFLHQIQEPTPVLAVRPGHIEQPLGMVLNALLQSEAALEVAISRVLKADPGHSISVTSEAKALVAVRAALSATTAADIVNPITGTAAPVVQTEPDASLNEVMELIGQFGLLVMHEDAQGSIKHTELIKSKLRALLATGGQALAVPVAVTTAEELMKLSGENAGSKMATMFHPSASGFQVKLYIATQAQANGDRDE